jgi:hypothetical protein
MSVKKQLLLAVSSWLLALSLISVVRRLAPEARREVSPARKRWVNCFRMRALEARHLVSHIFSERNAYCFQHKRAAENHRVGGDPVGCGGIPGRGRNTESHGIRRLQN